MQPTGFSSIARFRAWLRTHHATKTELLVRCAKVGVGKGLTYKQALDEALCFGWIDGVRRSIDTRSFSVRFTPRKPKSYWSDVNIRRARELEAEGRMHPAGRAAFASRPKEAPRRYSFERRKAELDPAFRKRMRADPQAWAGYQAQPPWYRRVTAHWVTSAKKPETREKRLALLLECSKKGCTIPMLTRKPRG